MLLITIIARCIPHQSEARSSARPNGRNVFTFAKNRVANLRVLCGLSSDTEFLLFHEWESIDALQDHFDTPHMETFMSELPDVLNGEIVTRRYEVRSRERGAQARRESASTSDRAKNTERRVPKIIH